MHVSEVLHRSPHLLQPCVADLFRRAVIDGSHNDARTAASLILNPRRGLAAAEALSFDGSYSRAYLPREESGASGDVCIIQQYGVLFGIQR